MTFDDPALRAMVRDADPYAGRIWELRPDRDLLAEYHALEQVLCTCDPDTGACTCGWDDV